MNTAAKTDYLNLLGVKKLWKRNISGKNIKIAVIEGAVNSIGDKLKVAGWFDTNTNVYSSSFPTKYPLDSHAFNTASVIAGVDVGIAPEALIYNVIINTNNVNDDTLLVSLKRGLKWCITNNIDIINLSIEILKVDSELLALANLAALKNITIICAFGNNALNPFICSPLYIFCLCALKIRPLS